MPSSSVTAASDLGAVGVDDRDVTPGTGWLSARPLASRCWSRTRTWIANVASWA